MADDKATAQNTEHAAVVETRLEWSGPLPPPQTLIEFDAVIEGGAERIFRAWESETQHRRELETKELSIYALNSVPGRVFSFIFVMSALGLAAFMASSGYPWLGVLLGGGTIASVVWRLTR